MTPATPRAVPSHPGRSASGSRTTRTGRAGGQPPSQADRWSAGGDGTEPILTDASSRRQPLPRSGCGRQPLPGDPVRVMTARSLGKAFARAHSPAPRGDAYGASALEVGGAEAERAQGIMQMVHRRPAPKRMRMGWLLSKRTRPPRSPRPAARAARAVRGHGGCRRRASSRHPVRVGSKDRDQAGGTRDQRGRSRSTRVPCSRASSWSQSGTTGSTRRCAADVTASHRRARWPVRPCPGPAGCHRSAPRPSRPAWSRAARPARPRRRRARRSSSRSATWCC